MILGNVYLTTEESREDFQARIDELTAKLNVEESTNVAIDEHSELRKMIEDNKRYKEAEGKVFHSVNEVQMAYANGVVSLHNRIAIPASAIHKDEGTGIPE